MDPINLEQWIKTQVNNKPLCQSNIENAALQLTTKLMEMQQMETPVTLNSLLSSQLLQTSEPSIQMSSLLERSSMIYDYIKTKRIKTYMTYKPMKSISEKHVRGLGFNMN